MNAQTPTAFDLWSGVASAALYLLVGVGALTRAPRDARARTFSTIAIASLAPYLLPEVMTRIGSGPWMACAVLVTGGSLAIGSLALFHFSQVFPTRRPLIQSAGHWLAPAYVIVTIGSIVGSYALVPLIPLMAEFSRANGSGGLGAVSSDIALLLLFVLIPMIFVVGIVLPVGALLSFYKSWQEAKRDGRHAARVTTLAILISQLAGGVLTILVVPLLHLIAPSGPWVGIASALLFGCGLLFPISFAVGVWRYGLIADG